MSGGNFRHPNFGVVTIDWEERTVVLEVRDEENRTVFAVRVALDELRSVTGRSGPRRRDRSHQRHERVDDERHFRLPEVRFALHYHEARGGLDARRAFGR